jgi:hypothetical protein
LCSCTLVAKPLAKPDLLDPKKYCHHLPAKIYSRFLNNAGITNLEPGHTIELPSWHLVNTHSQFYFFKQYKDMKEQIMKVCARGLRHCLTPENNKNGVIVTGTSGIGRMHSTLSYSSNSFCRQVHLLTTFSLWKLLQGIMSFTGLVTNSISSMVGRFIS